MITKCRVTTNCLGRDCEAHGLFVGGINTMVEKIHPTAIIVCGKVTDWRGYGGASGRARRLQDGCYYDSHVDKVTEHSSIIAAEYYLSLGMYVVFLHQDEIKRPDLLVDKHTNRQIETEHAFRANFGFTAKFMFLRRKNDGVNRMSFLRRKALLSRRARR